MVKDAYNDWVSILILTLLMYVICHGLMLIVFGAWWDDMLLWNVSQENIDFFLGPDNFNNPFLFYIIKSISSIENINVMTFIYRLVPFVCWLISVLSFFFFCKIITQNKLFTLYASLLAASCGLNKCMILICCYHYSISITLFMIGLALFTYDYYKNIYYLKWCVAVLWLFSLLVWRSAVIVIPAAIVIASIIKVGYDRRDPVNSIMKMLLYLVKKYHAMLICIAIFTLLYLTILAPKGFYASYYSVNLTDVLISPFSTLVSCLTIFLNYLSNVISIDYIVTSRELRMLLIWVLIVFLFTYKLKGRNMGEENSSSIFIIAVLFLFFSMMPHLLREYNICYNINGYTSRVASLAVFPISMLIAYFFYKINVQYKQILFSLFLLFSSLYSIKTYTEYNRGWAKNVEISQFLKENRYLDGCNIKFLDTAVDYSTFPSEDFRYYDMEGCARLAYGKYTKTRCSNYYHKGERDSNFKYDYFLYIFQKENYGLTQYIGNYLIPTNMPDNKNNLTFKLVKNLN